MFFEFALLALALGIVLAFHSKLSATRLTNGTGRKATKETEKEWYDFSWSGKNPERVILLAADMASNMNTYDAAKHMSSAFYSQVKHLMKKGRLLKAITFFVVSREYAEEALKYRQKAPLENQNPIDLEVLGAPEFMLAKIPIIGRFFRRKALRFLEVANGLIADKAIACPDKIDALENAIIWSKIYALTVNEGFKELILVMSIPPDADRNQLIRVARHLDMTFEEFCDRRRAQRH